VLADIEALGFIQNAPRIFTGVPERLYQRNEFLDGLLEENIIFPERIVGIDEQGQAGHSEALL
jgi:hypothetical protein